MEDNYKEARRQFELIAGHRPTEPLPEDPLLALQIKLYRWQVDRFGLVNDLQMVLGMIEECALELTESELTSDIGAKDAVADTLIYGSQLFNNNRMVISVAVRHAIDTWQYASGSERTRLKCVGQLARIALKGNQKIRNLGVKEVYRSALYTASVDLFAHMAVRVQSLEETMIHVAETVILPRDKGHEAIPA